ncbi:ISL3 family transposase [Streptomyces sp. NPDC049541]|uniref:ISL3 family transposase n=1 Tax=Streptomyces sp. NPDC049541 TaxID=3365594 RepID=UPI00379C2DA7
MAARRGFLDWIVGPHRLSALAGFLQPLVDGGDQHGCFVADGKLVVSRGDRAVSFEAIDAALHRVAPFVVGRVEFWRTAAADAALLAVGDLIALLRLGVDEFAFRKGCTYGTVLVDVESGRVVDVLPDRTSETFATWLTEHPGVEIICRDRATAHTKAVKEAAPNALEVADRWHLLQNLSAAVEKTCHQHRDCLRKRAEEETVTEVPEMAPMLLAPAELPRTQTIERTRHRYEDIHRLLERRWTISAIARRLNLDRKTVRRFRDTGLDQLLASARDRRPNGVLEPFKANLNARFTEAQGQVSGTRLFLEIQASGYRGSRQVVRKHLAALRAGTAEPIRADIPSPRKITSWIMRPRETLTESQDERLLQVRLVCPDISRACDLARAFADLVRHRRGFLLMEWIRQAEQEAPKPMKGFAGFLRQDLDAVTAGLTLPWSSGAVEGNVNRVKTLKRAMYGRASFSLLRTRILIRP